MSPSSMSTGPGKILSIAIKAVPPVRWALGVVGVMAAFALGKNLFSNTTEAIVGALAMFVLMILLVVFAAVTKISSSALKLPGLVLTWLMMTLFIAIAALTVFSAFFKWPLSFEDLRGQFERSSVAPDPLDEPTVPSQTLVTPSMLPSKMLTPVSGALDSSAVAQQLARKGSLTLDGNILEIGKVGANLSVTIAVHTLTLKGGARILTNGNNLTIQAIRIISGGSIVSFLPAEKRTPGIAGTGQPGVAGREAGTVYLEAVSGLTGKLDVKLFGQDGGKGGPGAGGAAGSAGSRGSNAVEGFLDCRSGGQDGGKGGPGNPGQAGGVGGNGGKGGALILLGNLIRQKNEILFTKNGGSRGEGGEGGPGGPGGPGGEGGSGSLRCGGGHGGQPGEPGQKGQDGAKGAPGKDGPDLK